MFENRQLVQFDTILPHLKANNTNQALKTLATIAAKDTGLPADMLYDSLVFQENEAGSGIGRGVALPHLCIKGLKRPYAVLARLNRAIDFESVDGKPSDLVALLLSPAEDGPYHLRRLARFSRLLCNATFCHRLRRTEDEDSLHFMVRSADPIAMAA